MHSSYNLIFILPFLAGVLIYLKTTPWQKRKWERRKNMGVLVVVGHRKKSLRSLGIHPITSHIHKILGMKNVTTGLEVAYNNQLSVALTATFWFKTSRLNEGSTVTAGSKADIPIYCDLPIDHDGHATCFPKSHTHTTHTPPSASRSSFLQNSPPTPSSAHSARHPA